MKRYILLILFAAVLLSSCSQTGNGEMQETVSNLFDSLVTQPSEILPGEESEISPASLGFGLSGAYTEDLSYRRSYLYHGGEMNLGYWIEAEGYSNIGLGMFLFVDGQPQPFKTESDGTERYMHILYPPEGKKITGQFIFTPVSGKQGNTLEIYTMHINYPAHSIDDPPGVYQTFGAGAIGSRMLLEQTPPSTIQPVFQERILSSSIIHTDLAESEIRGWSEEDLRSKLEYHFYVNGRKDFAELFSIADSEPLDCRFEMWGCPNGEFTLTIFLNHEPVYVQDISTNDGQKTIAEIQLDMTGYGTEGVLFAVLVPKNQFSQKLDYGLETSGTFYLTSAASEAELKGSD